MFFARQTLKSVFQKNFSIIIAYGKLEQSGTRMCQLKNKRWLPSPLLI